MARSVHEALSQIYETGAAPEKVAAGGVVGGIFGAVAARALQRHDEQNRKDALALTNAIRAELARKNAPIYEGFRSGAIMPSYGVGEYNPETMPEDMIRLASAIGADLALYSMAKQAGIGGFGGLGKAIGGAVSGAAKSVGQGILKMPTIKGSGSLAQGAFSGAKNLATGIGGGLKAAPGALASFGQNKLTQAGNALSTGVQNASQSAQQAWSGFKNNMQQRSLTRQYGMQRAGQRLESSLSRAGQRVESALGGTPQPFKPLVSIDPQARRAAAQTRLSGMQQKGIRPGGGAQPAGQLAATPNPVQPPQTKTTDPAPVQQPVQGSPQGNGAPYRASPAQQPQPQQHATAQNPAPAPQPAQPPATGPAAQGAPAQPANEPAKPPMPPPTPAAGQAKPAAPPPPTPQATPSNPTASTSQAGQQGPAASPAQTAQTTANAGSNPLMDQIQAGWQRTGLANGAWQKKLPLLAGGALGAYALYRGGRAAFDWAGQESHPEAWGNPYLQPASTVNEMGYAQR